jgi:hypothetical protein
MESKVWTWRYLLQDSNDPRLSLMENQIVYLVIPMDRGPSIFRLKPPVFEIGQHLVDMWNLSYGLLRININRLGLRFADGGECFNLAVIEASRPPVTLETDIFWNNAMQLC